MREPSRIVFRAASVVALAVAAATGPAAAVTALFHDGFERCGHGRWLDSATPYVVTEPTPTAVANALDACGTELAAASYRLADGSVPTNPVLQTITGSQVSVMRAFGSGGLLPRSGTMAVLSNGTARDQLSPGYSANANWGRTDPLPAAYLASHGGLLPCLCGSPDAGHDSVSLRLVLNVPASATQLLFDWRYLTNDALACGIFNDFFLALVQGTAPGLPADQNVALEGADPASADYLTFAACTGCPGGTGPLAGTGATAATDWRTATVPVVGGETLTLDLVVFDVGDGVFDSTVLVDDLRWSP